MQKMGINKNSFKGFTIVELLIVIVVIAILAAITIVAYNGVTARTKQSILQNDITSLRQLVETYKIDNGSYATSISQLNNGAGYVGSNGDTFAYTTSSGNYYLSGTNSDKTYYYKASNTTSGVQSGYWPGHDGLLTGYPSRDGYANLTGVITGDAIIADISSVPVGGWMIIAMTWTTASDFTPPAGWTALIPRHTTNTMQSAVYARIKQSGDASTQSFEAPGSNGALFTNVAFMWGQNSLAVGSWSIGSWGDRASNATPSTTVTPTTTTTTAKSLVLSLAFERTTATETNYTSLTGVTPWVWIPQPDASAIQTIAVGYEQKATTGTTAAMTVTYPNTQNTNGAGIQIVIPPAS